MSPPLGFQWPEDEFKSSHKDVFTTAKNLVTKLINNKTDMDITTKAAITDSPQVGMTTPTTQGITEDPPTEISTENILTTLADSISTTVRNIMTTMSTNDEVTIPPSGTENGFNLSESTNSNSTIIIENNNSTVLTELSGSNNTIEENITTTGRMLDGFTTSVTNTVTETVRNVINSTTEKITNIINNSTNEMINNQTNLHESPEHMPAQNNSLIIYIIVGVLLGILVLIFIALFIFYKQKKCPQSSGDYYVTQLKDVSYSSSKASSNTDDINVKL